jgi:ubiquitin C-terminal hydrolase
LNTDVGFPLENLDLSKFTLSPQETPPIYDLYAVSNHYGSLGGGHYTAIAKSPDGKWYSFDDSTVSPVKHPNDIRTSAAYVLFYRRRRVSEDEKAKEREKELLLL